MGLGESDDSSPEINPNGDIDVKAQIAWIWCIQCSDLDDKTTHQRTRVLVVCDPKTGEPKYLGTGGEDKIKKPCACRPEKLDGSRIHANRSSSKYVYALTYLHPDTEECLNFAVDFDTEINTLTVLDVCNFSLNELEHTLGSYFSIPWNPVTKNNASKNLAMLLP